ncbi:hypothetical protein LVD17_00335 [Fulvivirga ulvae]|uniref:hypothetical protein n=1 Tax=Fulvivirga ulvae TaxID=2904245 RepID=UPI001F20DAB8|nr:hypothetical protein [Fulvivirga ulvae]UII32284.1 hypothetical protein LVD17_00335 [Fulvivirga ulvae]
MKRLVILMILTMSGQVAHCQKSNILISHNQFFEIKLGETSFTDAEKKLRLHSYKEPKLNFRSIRWRSGGCSTLFTHQYFIKLKGSKLHVVLFGYKTVDRIRIRCDGPTKLSFNSITLGKSRVEDVKLSRDKWEEVTDLNGEWYLTNEFNGIWIDIPGDASELLKKNWIKKRINQITLRKMDG